MKAKIVVFLIIFGLTAVGFVLSHGFTYVNGVLSERAILFVRIVFLTPVTLAFCWVIKPILKRLSQKVTIVDFRELRDS